MSTGVTAQQQQQIQQSAGISSYVDSQAAYGYVQQQGQQIPSVQIDERIVAKQKEKALKELESRVKLALLQHDQMYQAQRNHIIAEHDRQLQLAKSAIEHERANTLMALDQQFQQNNRGIEHSAQSQKIQIEQQANLAEIQSMQQKMVMQHAERERQWSGGYPAQQPSLFSPPLYQTSYQPNAAVYTTVQQPQQAVPRQ
jgi:hypothetical protein